MVRCFWPNPKLNDRNRERKDCRGDAAMATDAMLSNPTASKEAASVPTIAF
jgi:hypothetical protein